MKYYRLNKDWYPFKEGDKFEYDDKGDGRCTLVSNDAVSACIPSNYLDELPGSSWKPEDGECYFYINDTGDYRTTLYYESSNYDKGRRSIGNYFKTREDAEAAANWLKARHNLIESGAVFMNASDADEGGAYYNVTIDKDSRELMVRQVYSLDNYVSDRALYFDDCESAKISIKEHKENWLIYLGVNENNDED